MINLLSGTLLNSLNQMLRGALSGTTIPVQDARALAATPLLLEVHDMQLCLLIDCHGQDICISRADAQAQLAHTGVRIGGTLTVLLHLAMARDKQQAIATQSGLQLSGETAAIYCWQRSLQGLHINWEGELTRRLGPLVAGPIIQLAKTARHQARQLAERAPSAIGHSLLANQLAVSTSEIQAFSSEAEVLRLRVDKLRTRLDRLARR